MPAPPAPARLTDAQLYRYARQILLPELGGRGQRALLSAEAHVHLEDLAAAQVALAYLAGAGVGALVLFGARSLFAHDAGLLIEPQDAGQPAAAALARRIAARTPDVTVRIADDAEPAPAFVALGRNGARRDVVAPPWPGPGDAAPAIAALWRGAAAATELIRAVLADARAPAEAR